MSLRVEVTDLTWQAAGREVLAGVTWSPCPGVLTAVMGRNGAGKSTLLDLVAGLRRPHRGVIRLDGRPLETWTPAARARVVSHLPQAVRADLPVAGEELVMMGRYPHTPRWIETATDRRVVEQAMRRTGCWTLRARTVHTLSGGERQRVLLAACLAQAPRLLLLDEPSTYLDVDQQLQIFTLLREECDRGLTCVAVMHDINLALTFADRLMVLEGGRVALDAPVCAALETDDWLGLFSTRLRLREEGGRPWVVYQ